MFRISRSAVNLFKHNKCAQFLPDRVASYWNKTPYHVKDASSVDAFKLESYKNSSTMASKTNVVDTTLTNDEISRYTRQMILDDVGRPGQEALKKAKVLIIGVGGLGCPAAQYLVAAGVGTVGLLDEDTVDTSNLHRQVLHSEASVGLHKVDSAVAVLSKLNSCVKLIPHKTDLNASNAMSILADYDIILDCTDNATTRYLISDCCVWLNKPLVYGAALRTEGQLTTYNYDGGPCYRCVNPVPPNPDITLNCMEAGVIGPVTGMIGSLQATECIKIISTGVSAYSGKLLITNPWEGLMRVVRLRGKQSKCAVCGDAPTITAPIDYVLFCGPKDKAFKNESKRHERITCKELAQIEYNNVIDVRPAVEYGICALKNTVSVPYFPLIAGKLDSQVAELIPKDTSVPVYVLCRAGNNSQPAVQYLKKQYPEHEFKDVIAGLIGWKRDIDQDFPIY